MIKLVIVGGCAADKTRDAAHRHMRTVHGPMVYDPPPDAGPMPSYYAQNPAFDDAGALPALWRGDRDFVTEVGFGDIGDLKAATSTPYSLDRLRPDEGNFVNQATVQAVATREETRSGSESPEAVRLFLFLKRRGSQDEFGRRCALVERMVDGAVTARASDVALPVPDGREASFDRIERLSFADRAAALAFVQRSFAALVEPLAPCVETPGSFALLVDHYSVARLKGSRG